MEAGPDILFPEDMYSAGQHGKKGLLSRSQMATSGSSIKSQVLDSKTLPIFSPLKISVKKSYLSVRVFILSAYFVRGLSWLIWEESSKNTILKYLQCNDKGFHRLFG